MPVKNSREYRAAALLQPTTGEKRIDSECYVEGYATTFDSPYELYEGLQEVISSRALTSADMSDVIMQYDHEGRVYARQSNGTLIVEPDAHGLFVAADLSKSAASRALYEEIQAGLITRMSWAFVVDDDEYDKATRTRTITRVGKVYDVSAVSIPANDATEISARSFVDGVIDMETQELRARRIKALKLSLEL